MEIDRHLARNREIDDNKREVSISVFAKGKMTMAETQLLNPRPDIDVETEIQNKILQGYPPMLNDRHHVDITVSNGRVTLSGHVKTPMTRRFVLSKLERISGVTSIDASALYDDETIRLQAGKVIPSGVLVTSNYGTVILAGKPGNVSPSEIARRIAQITGVKQVVTAFN
jgi:osmotically-inducible protein OsmY